MEDAPQIFIVGLLISIIITWGIGLIPPLLIRFVILRRPISKRYAIVLVILFGLINFVIFAAIADTQGRRPGGAFILIGFVSYWILRKVYERKYNKIFKN